MDKNKNYLLLKKFTQQLGINLFGVADISQIKNGFSLPEQLLERFDKAISLGIKLSSSVLEEIKTHPTKLYFHHYRTVNAFLDQIALRLANFIQDKGFYALPIPASQIVDWQNQIAHLSHKNRLFGRIGVDWQK